AQEAHRPQLHGEAETHVIPAAATDEGAICIVEIEEPSELLGRRLAIVSAVATLLFVGEEADGHRRNRLAEILSSAGPSGAPKTWGLRLAKISRIAARLRNDICKVIPTMNIGYARVSTDDQDLRLQLETLKGANCRRVYQEKKSGARADRPELRRMIDNLREGDVVVVARLDRLARSTRDLLELAEAITAAGASLKSLGEPWADTTTPAGKMVLTVFAGIAEFERSLIRERTGAGRVAAKKRGVKFGRKPKLTPEQV